MSLIRSGSTTAEPALGLRCEIAVEGNSRLAQSSQPIASSPAILQQTSTPPSFSLVVRRVPPQPQHTTPAAGKKGPPEVTSPFPRYLTGPRALWCAFYGCTEKAALRQDAICDHIEHFCGLAARSGSVEDPASGQMLTCIRAREAWRQPWEAQRS